ncbi:MAG: hypothetical protein L3K23_03470 [Thermoplasmata archaeon]|nr:hypothetical protein [Thermoplasmata archaeon]
MRRLVIVGIVIAVALTTFLAFALVPVRQQFTLRGTAIYDPNSACQGIHSVYCSEVDTTQGTTLVFHWSAPTPITFFVVSLSANQEAYDGNGSSGSGSLVSVGGFYQFGAACPEGPCVAADVSGSFTGPLLALW